MAKFKVGDRVRREEGWFNGMAVGDEAVVINLVDEDHVELAGYPGVGVHWESNLELVTPKVERAEQQIIDRIKELQAELVQLKGGE